MKAWFLAETLNTVSEDQHLTKILVHKHKLHLLCHFPSFFHWGIFFFPCMIMDFLQLDLLLGGKSKAV